MNPIGILLSGLVTCSPLIAQDSGENPTQEEAMELAMNSPIRTSGAPQEGESSFTVEKDSSLDQVNVNAFFQDDLVGQLNLNSENPTGKVELPVQLAVADEVELYDANSGRLLLTVSALPATYLRGNVSHVGAYGDSEAGADDVVFLYNYLIGAGPAPANLIAADVDGNGTVDFEDLVVLYQHVIDVPYYKVEGEFIIEKQPKHDLRSDGTPMPLATFYNAVAQSWGESHTPPRKGEPVFGFDDDGKPETKEWFYPCTFAWRTGPPGSTGIYYSMAISRGPRKPVEGEVLDGGNCVHTLYYYCLDFVPTFPFFEVTRTRIGQCTYPTSGNYAKQLDNGVMVYQCQNEEVGNDESTTYTYNPEFDILQVFPNDATTPSYQGSPNGYTGWSGGSQ